MKINKEIIIVCIISFFVTFLFFYKSVLLHQVPFPGDLLVSENPYKTQSFLGYAPGGYPNIAQGMDVITELLPWKKFSTDQMKQGQLPFWNPHNFSGNILMQNFQSAIFYPFNMFFFMMPFATAWTVFIFFQPFLAIVFMYLFLRSLGLQKAASVSGAIAFGFSSYMTVWVEYGNIDNTLLWLPLLLFALNRYLSKPKIRFFLLAILSLTMSFLAGYIQGVFYMYLVAFLFVLYRILFKSNNLFKKYQVSSIKVSKEKIKEKKENNIRKINSYLSLLFVFLLPVFLTSFQILPTLSAFQQSTRSNYSLPQIQNLLQPIYYWLTIFAPDFFGNPAHRNFFLPITYIERVMYFGIPFIFFIMLAIVKARSRDLLFFFSIGIVILLLTTNIPFVQYIYLLPIPMISTTVPTRALSIFIFCMITAGTYGVDYWMLHKKPYKTFVPVLFVGLYLTIWIGTIIFAKFIPVLAANRSVSLHNLIIPSIIAFVTIAIFYSRHLKLGSIIAPCALICLVSVDLFINFQKITPFAPSSLMYPRTPVISYLQHHAGLNRFWGYGEGYMLPNFQTFDGTYSPEGNDPLHSKEYGLLLTSSRDGEYPNLLPRPDANIAPGYGLTDMQNSYRQQILNLLGVKYVVYQENTLSAKPRYDVFPEKNYQLLWHEDSWQIYQNEQVLPRFFLTSHYVVETNTKKAVTDIYKTNLAHTLILNKTPETTLSPGASGSISVTSYNPNTVTFSSQTTGNTLLFFSDAYAPSWKAAVDTLQTPIYKADVSFRAVVVPQGKHTITFTYTPQYFTLGLQIAMVSLLICIGYSLYLYKYER